jgi:ABC-type glycerol-3-phosphate transport system permease component
MVLQYVAASFQLPSVSTANINTVQYPKSYERCKLPAVPAVVIPKVLLPQSNILQPLFIATTISSLMSLQACQHSNHNVTKFTNTIAAAAVIVVVVVVVVFVVTFHKL